MKKNIENSEKNDNNIKDYEQKINDTLNLLKNLCKNKNEPNKSRVISDKCEDACQRNKACAKFTEGATAEDLQDAYDTCMEECVAWPQKTIKCINAVEIKNSNDCVRFVQCHLPEYYEENYK